LSKILSQGERGFVDDPIADGNNFNYFSENHLTKNGEKQELGDPLYWGALWTLSTPHTLLLRRCILVFKYDIFKYDIWWQQF